MIPLRDTIPSQTWPIVNYTLIGINIFAFFIQLSKGPAMQTFVYTYGLVPARFTDADLRSYFSLGQQLLSLVTFMFLHGGFWHILGNMWTLYIFGDNVEDHLGSFSYLIFYLATGLASGLLHLVLNLDSNIPTIGASGAIAGVMGAYFILYPKARILTLIPIFIFPLIIEIPAFFFLGIWFVLQVLNAMATGNMVSGIAWWAHIGGFVSGVLFLQYLSNRPNKGFSERLKQVSVKKRTSDRIQVLHPMGEPDDVHLYEIIRITSHEAMTGAKKMINIPWGFYNRMYRLTIPAGTKEGTVLRLGGQGRHAPDGRKGDLFLKVKIV
jgi:membrane associated rhomboid family serine protease